MTQSNLSLIYGVGCHGHAQIEPSHRNRPPRGHVFLARKRKTWPRGKIPFVQLGESGVAMAPKISLDTNKSSHFPPTPLPFPHAAVFAHHVPLHRLPDHGHPYLPIHLPFHRHLSAVHCIYAFRHTQSSLRPMADESHPDPRTKNKIPPLPPLQLRPPRHPQPLPRMRNVTHSNHRGLRWHGRPASASFFLDTKSTGEKAVKFSHALCQPTPLTTRESPQRLRLWNLFNHTFNPRLQFSFGHPFDT